MYRGLLVCFITSKLVSYTLCELLSQATRESRSTDWPRSVMHGMRVARAVKLNLVNHKQT